MALVSGWAAAATEWLYEWGPVAWVGAGFLGAFLTLLVIWLEIKLTNSYAAGRIRRKLYARGDLIDPMDHHFYNKRIFLHGFIPPAGHPVEGKTFERCEIIGPLNILPFGCSIESSLYVTTDYISIDVDAFLNGRVLNAQRFVNCRFINCKFYYISILVNETERDAFDKYGGCNWITRNHRASSHSSSSQPRPETAAPQVIEGVASAAAADNG